MEIKVTFSEYEFLLQQLGYSWEENHTEPLEDFLAQVDFIDYVRAEIGAFEP